MKQVYFYWLVSFKEQRPYLAYHSIASATALANSGWSVLLQKASIR